jgi:plastocyanin
VNHAPAPAPTRRTPRRALLCLALLALLLGGAALPASPAALAQDGVTVDVAIRSFAFSPDELRIPAGTTVVWTNYDSALHNVISQDGTFISSPELGQGERFSQRFDQPGVFAYFCAPHPSMVGTLIVEEPRIGDVRLHLPLLAQSGE